MKVIKFLFKLVLWLIALAVVALLTLRRRPVSK